MLLLHQRALHNCDKTQCKCCLYITCKYYCISTVSLSKKCLCVKFTSYQTREVTSCSSVANFKHQLRSTVLLSKKSLCACGIHYQTREVTSCSNRVLCIHTILFHHALDSSLVFINARRMRTRVTVVSLFVCLFVCLCVCLSVCYCSTAYLWHLYEKINIPANFSLNSKDFQLRDWAKTLSISSYSLFFICSTAKLAIFQVMLQ